MNPSAVRTTVGLSALLLVIIAVALIWLSNKDGRAVRHFVTHVVDQGPVRLTVRATGALRPVKTYLVGTQITGPVLRVFADVGSKVEKGQVLAEIDPALLQSEIAQTEAQVKSSESNLFLAARNAKRLCTLMDEGYVSKADCERVEQERIVAEASFKVAQAQLNRDKQNLAYAYVRSPSDGVVIERMVNEGQTIQASFQSPEMFKIAESLDVLELELQVPESDISHIRIGQLAQFTVDAFPDTTFNGKLEKINQSPTSNEGTVTYAVKVGVTNEHMQLLVGMTAYVSIVIQETGNVVRIPRQALWYGKMLANEKKRSGMEVQDDAEGKVPVAVSDGNEPHIVYVATGISDSTYTEVKEGEITAGTTVIVRETTADEGQS